MGEVVSLTKRKKEGGAGEKKKRGGGGGAPPGERDEIERLIGVINRDHALVKVGDKALVLHETEDSEGRPLVAFMTLATFRAWWATKRVPDFEKGEMAGIGDLWVKHPLRRQYEGVTFRPRHWDKEKWDFEDDDVPEGWYNLWTGFSVRPADPLADKREHVRHFRTLYDHVRRNVAGGNDDLAKWLWCWAAKLVQRPRDRDGTAIIARGKRGTGKTVVGEVLGGLIGQHYTMIDDPKHLVGNFNAHMAACTLLQAEEGFWAGDKTAEGRLKSLVTSSVQLIERKGVDAIPLPNYVHLYVSSNEEWVVPAGLEERRWAVFDVGDGNMQDRAFFAQLKRELDEGGREHLLAWLLQFDLSAVDVAVIPQTAGLLDQKLASLDPHLSWWLDCLQRGGIAARQRKWPEVVKTDDLYRSYTDYVEQLGRRSKKTKQELGIALRTLAPGIKAGRAWFEKEIRGPDGELIRTSDGKVPKERLQAYEVPGLTLCRNHFARMIRSEIRWPDDDLNEGPAAMPTDDGQGAGAPPFNPEECPF